MSTRKRAEQKPLEVESRAASGWLIRSGEKLYRTEPNELRCSCPGWLPRRPCRHLRFVLAQLEGRSLA